MAVIGRAFKTEGLTWLFKGWTPAWIRLSPNTILILCVAILLALSGGLLTRLNPSYDA